METYFSRFKNSSCDILKNVYIGISIQNYFLFHASSIQKNLNVNENLESRILRRLNFIKMKMINLMIKINFKKRLKIFLVFGAT